MAAKKSGWLVQVTMSNKEQLRAQVLRRVKETIERGEELPEPWLIRLLLLIGPNNMRRLGGLFELFGKIGKLMPGPRLFFVIFLSIFSLVAGFLIDHFVHFSVTLK